MKDRKLSNKIKRKTESLQEPSTEGASEGLVKRACKSFNGDLNMNKVIFVDFNLLYTLQYVVDYFTV